MKFSKTIFIFLILLTTAQFCFAQEKPEAVLVDALGEGNNSEDKMARLDNYFVGLMENPNEIGYVVISSPEKDFFKTQLRYKNTILGYAETRKFDSGRISIIHQKKDYVDIQLWRAQAGAKPADVVGESWSNDLSNIKSSFIFGYDTEDTIFITAVSAKLLTEYLNANSNFNAKIVFEHRTLKDSYSYGKYWIKKLTEEYQIPRSRIRAFYGKTPRNIAPGALFWLVPVKKKNFKNSATR